MELVSLDKLTNNELLKCETFGLNEAQSETQPVPGALLQDSAEIPIVLESEADIQDPEIPTQRAHFFNPNELVGKHFSVREKLMVQYTVSKL